MHRLAPMEWENGHLLQPALSPQALENIYRCVAAAAALEDVEDAEPTTAPSRDPETETLVSPAVASSQTAEVLPDDARD